MEVTPGYKQTEAGVVPEDWEAIDLSDLCTLQRGFDITEATRKPGTVPVYSSSGLSYFHNKAMVLPPGVVTGRKGILGKVFLIHEPFWPHDTTLWVKDFKGNYPAYVALVLQSFHLERLDAATSVPTLNRNNLAGYYIALPPTKAEQEAIAEALGDADALIDALEQLLAKKRNLKQGAMQDLLTGKKRLPGFKRDWDVKTLQETMDCFDNVRIPLNETQRARMKGDYPYCGANGVLDYVNDYVIDDDIILIAEDGGYFDEYAHRPIAYRMMGKCWVNNHAHILKAKTGFDQGFLFYSLVHKDILTFLASGTRAKLNKSEMWKIEVRLPLDPSEQNRIASVLTDMDAEIAGLEQKLGKAREIKQGMMQELLTGRTRLL
jgi:type I restriction enzyme, S subunit